MTKPQALRRRQDHLYGTAEECVKAFRHVEAAADELKCVPGKETDAQKLAEAAELMKRLDKECRSAADDMEDEINRAFDELDAQA